MRYRLIGVVALTLLVSFPAFAGKQDELRLVTTQLKKQKEQVQQLSAQERDIEKTLGLLQKKSVSLAGDVQAYERAWSKVQKRQEETKSQIADTEKTLDQQRGSLAQVILALQRLNRMPPQMLLVRPAAPIDTARSYHILQQVIPTISEQATAVKETLEKLAGLQQTLAAQEMELQQTFKKLKAQRAKLDSTIAERKELLQRTQNDRQRADAKSKSLAQQAKTLRELLDHLDTQGASRPKTNQLGDKIMGWFKGGTATLPVIGNIKTAYGQTLAGGGESQGLTIDAPAQAVVVAPSDGTVRFAGPFRQYRLLVIVQHANGEHSLLGGLQETYVRVGDTVIKGEPVGKLSGDSGPSASLYYERRRNGKPIDPRQARG